MLNQTEYFGSIERKDSREAMYLNRRFIYIYIYIYISSNKNLLNNL